MNSAAATSTQHAPVVRIPVAAGDYIDGVKRIAVLRANAVGDFIVALPALHALKAAYPQASVTLLGRAWHAEFLRGRPGPIDEVVVLPDIPGLTVDAQQALDEAPLTRFVDEMRARRFDLALQWHGGGRHSNGFLRSLNARVHAGFVAFDAPSLDRGLPYAREFAERLRLLDGARQVGASTYDDDPHVAVTQADRQALAQALPALDRPVVLLQPGATDPRRRWPAHCFAALGDALQHHGMQVVINGTAQEEHVVSSVIRHMKTAPINLCGRLSLGALAACCERARLVVSNDTGPLHLARAVGTPNIGIFWMINLIAYGPVRAHRDLVATSWRTTCPACGQDGVTHDCGHRESWVADVGLDEVVRLARLALGFD